VKMAIVKPGLKIPILLILLMLFFVLYFIFWVRDTPYRLVRTFIYAIENRNILKIHELTIPQERNELGVTPEAIKIILQNTLWRYEDIRGVIENIHLYNYWGIALGRWCDSKTGRPIPANFGPPDRPKEMDLAISFVRLTPEGWRISTARFLAGRCFQTFGNLELCRRVGIKGQVDVMTGHIIPLDKLEEEIAFLFRR
jgi:hypothetical protein